MGIQKKLSERILIALIDKDIVTMKNSLSRVRYVKNKHLVHIIYNLKNFEVFNCEFIDKIR